MSSSELVDPFNARQYDEVADPPVWRGEQVPAWCYQSDGVRIVNSLKWAVPPDSLAKTSERAWAYIARVNLLVWCFWAVCPLAGLFLSQCNGGGLATNPQALIAIYMPVLALALYWEVQAHGYIMPAQLKYLGEWRCLGKPRSWRVYYAAGLGVSLFGHLDLATNGIFMARVVKSAQCSDGMELFWSRVVANSALKMLPPITILAVTGYLLMLPQLVFALLCGVPQWSDIAARELFHTKVRDDWFALHGEYWKWEPMKTAFGCANGDGLLAALASSARAGLVTFRTSAFEIGMTHGFGFQAYRYCRRDFVIAMRNTAWRGFLNFLSEGAIQANLQVSVLALTKALADGAPADMLTAVSALLSIMMLWYNITVTGSTMFKMTRRAWYRLPPVTLSQVMVEKYEGAVDTDEEVCERRAWIVRLWIVFGLSAALSLGLSLYAGVKLAAAVFVCKMGVWNLSGCVSSLQLRVNV